MNKCLFKGALFGSLLLASVLVGSDALAQSQQSKSKANNAAAGKTGSGSASHEAKLARESKLAAAAVSAAPGTYQIQARNAQSHEAFPVDILVEIEKNRDQDKVVFLKAGESSVIKILPYKQINSKNFVPLPEYGVQE